MTKVSLLNWHYDASYLPLKLGPLSTSYLCWQLGPIKTLSTKKLRLQYWLFIGMPFWFPLCNIYSIISIHAVLRQGGCCQYGVPRCSRMYNVHIYVFILRRTANVTVMVLGLLPPILFSEAIFYCSSHLLVSASATQHHLAWVMGAEYECEPHLYSTLQHFMKTQARIGTTCSVADPF